jgi:hypothetical protein
MPTLLTGISPVLRASCYVKTIKAQDETRYAVELSTDLSPEQQSFWHHFLANQVQTSDPSQSPRLR